MDHYTRRIIGFGIHLGVVDGEVLCRMFKQAIRDLGYSRRFQPARATVGAVAAM
jgi:hypothetical protein